MNQLEEQELKLSDYSELVDRVRCNKAAGMPDKEACEIANLPVEEYLKYSNSQTAVNCSEF